LVICRIATGSPFPDPVGRWRKGGGINLQIKVIASDTTSSEVKLLMARLSDLGVQAE